MTDPPVAHRVRGCDGRTLAEVWAERGRSALHGAAIAGFPNLFFLVGPNTGLGHNSIVYLIESQVGYLVDALEQMAAAPAGISTRTVATPHFGRPSPGPSADRCGASSSTSTPCDGQPTSGWPPEPARSGPSRSGRRRDPSGPWEPSGHCGAQREYIVGLMPVNDSMFMISEAREQPMHVGGLQLFDLPAGCGSDYLGELYRESIEIEHVAPLFRRRPYRSPLTLGQWGWAEDRQIDLQHHVRHSALPQPGRVRELLALASRLHGTLLDRKRPLWEAHLIEGLEGNRFAVYTKLHHAMMDGVSALRLQQNSLSPDPDARDVPVPWEARERPSREKSAGGLLSLPFALPKAALELTGDALGLIPTLMRLAEHGLREQATALPLQAPRSMFNVSITGSRRFAAESWSLDRVKKVAKAADATVNDVMLAMCSGALRQYLLEQKALPEASLIAMTPVSLRKNDDDGQGGNAVGTILCNLATDLEHPGARLVAIHASMLAGKNTLAGLSQNQITALSAVVMAPLLLNSVMALHKVSPPPFNLVISNVPGSPVPLYWNGARMRGSYPLSIPTDGQALNITVTSYDGQLHFGLTGCRRSIPSLQRLLAHLEDSLGGLENAVL